MDTPSIILKSRLILSDQGKVLMLEQIPAKGGNYSLPGGRIELYENAKDSLIRETAEEIGIQVVAKDLELAHVLHKKTANGQRITLYFKTNSWEGDVTVLEPEKFVKATWFPLTSLPINTTSTVKHVLTQFQKGLMYSEFSKKGATHRVCLLY